MQLSRYIIFENDDYVAVNKPAGLLSIPDRHNDQLPSLSGRLEQHYGSIFVVHRLDKDTSGVMVFAKNEKAHKFFSAQFQSGLVDKHYLGLATGLLTQKEGTIDAPIMEHPAKKGKMMAVKGQPGKPAKKGKPARTTFRVLESFSLFTLLDLQIFTGRTHQIRVHLQSIGHPVAMDEVYGNGKPFYLSLIKKKYRIGKSGEEERPLMSRTALHSARLSFNDENGERQTLEAALPKDFQAVLNQLRKHARVQ